MNNILLKVSSVNKTYNKKTVLENINLNFLEGSFYAILGCNGAGKSTLMKLISQSEQPTKGQIFFNEWNLSDPKNSINLKTLFIDESPQLSLNMPLNEWVKTFKKTHSDYNEDRVFKLMKKFSIDPKAFSSNLSRGQKMKALFSLMAGKKNQLYLIDEITAVLDMGSRFVLVEFLKKEVERGCTVIMSTNIASEIPMLQTHICFLENGKVKMNCQYHDFSKNFIKLRTFNEAQEELILSYQGRLVGLNMDQSKTFIAPREFYKNLESLKKDHRQITIKEITTYLTTKGNSK